MAKNKLVPSEMLGQIKQVMAQARAGVIQTVNSELVLAYWKVGEII